MATARTRIPLQWLALLLTQRIGLQRTYHLKANFCTATRYLICDASPWGGGVALVDQWKPIAWISLPSKLAAARAKPRGNLTSYLSH